MKHVGWTWLLLFGFVNFAAATRVKDMLYMPINGAAACFRKHNGTHQFGCSSSRSGNVGAIHFVENELDIQWLEKNSTAGPYMIVLSFDMFTLENLKRFAISNNVNGVLLTRNMSLDRPASYSPEDSCPNRYSGYKSCDKPWNPYGSSILLEDWPFPMFYVQDQEMLKQIKACYLKYNYNNRDKQALRSLCALEMRAFMFAAVNSETCIRRGSVSSINFNTNILCSPLGDKSIHWPAGPMTDNVKDVIMVIARLDANALYENLVPGAGSTVTGLATLIATATYLHSLKPSLQGTNVVFSLLNGEALDYIGSSRLVYDLVQGNFVAIGGKTIKFNQISSVIELGQLGEGKIHFHASNFKNSSMLENLKKNLDAEILEGSVPPASIQSFLRANSSMPVVVVANHNETFTNKYYNSLLDDADGLLYSSEKPEKKLEKSLAKIAKSLGDELYRVITGRETSGNLTFVEDIMQELLPCYLESADCRMFHAASRPGTYVPKRVLPMYVSVMKSENDVTTLTGQLLALLTGEQLPELNIDACVEKHFIWLAGFDSNRDGVCVNYTANYSSAVSPAFIIDGYDMKSGIYSTWTESVWTALKMRMFLKPSAATERLSFILGSSITGVSFILVWFVTSRADVLFNTGSVDL
ncbi:nicastrin [Copidosoma floridanum]|uniref:nicastrin n=1 Tax=Copidosoma floridanum TaxID=29053 RepID=UPI0006C9726B|nr:nicastrin [Copidosoma floridanum]